MSNDSTSEELEQQLTLGADTIWLLLTGINILVMQVGFTAFETGASRAKHTKSVLFKNILDHAAGSVTWFFLGWGIYTGTHPVAGGYAESFGNPPVTEYSVIFQQFAFAATATTIVSGSVTGRCRLEAYVFLAAVLCGAIYPLQAHWAWSANGWLKALGFLDFAGSCVVHAFGAGCALATAWLCGPRPGRFVVPSKPKTRWLGTGVVGGGARKSKAEAAQLAAAMEAFPDDTVVRQPHNAPSALSLQQQIHRKPSAFELSFPGGETNKASSARGRCGGCGGGGLDQWLYKTNNMPMAGQNSTMMVVGALFLYIAWFSFNAGSSGSAVANPESSARAAINTLLASGAGSTMYFLVTILRKKRAYDIDVACNALLASLVGITAPCGYVEPWAAVVCGALSAYPMLPLGEFLVTRVFGVDDVLSAVSVHGMCGIFGTLWLGLVHPQLGAFYTGHGDFFGVQLLGCLVIPAVGFVCTMLLLLPFRFKNALAYSEDEQLLGLDLVHFGGTMEGVDLDLEDGGSNTEYRFVDENSSQRSQDEPGLMAHDGGGGEPKPSSSAKMFTVLKSNLGFDNGSSTSLDAGSSSNNAEAVIPPRSRQVSLNTFEGRKEAAFQLRRVLNDEDPRVRKRFRAYLNVLHAGEGVEFWDEVVKWKAVQSKKKRIREATRLINTYCLEDSKRQVNLQSKTVAKMRSALQDDSVLVKVELFDDALDELFKDLKQTFIEFVDRTPNYWL